MTNRVLMTPDRLKISKPGWDVTSAGHNGLSFNSDWAGATILITGQIYMPNNGQGNSIWFGRWFNTPPIVLFLTKIEGSSYNYKFGYELPAYDGQGGHYVTNDRVVLAGYNSEATPNGVTIDYLIWNYAT